MRKLLALLLTALLGACATTPAPPPDGLFHDALFAAPSERVGADDVFALSEAMRHYLRVDIADQLRRHGPSIGLFEALRDAGKLRLEYEATQTRNAAGAFEARRGNCLSLVLMTAALAKELGLEVRYQSAYLEETWSRNGNLLLRSGHVNVTLDRRLHDMRRVPVARPLTIDFLPPEDIRGLRVVEVQEKTIVAMYLNNRAAEALVAGRTSDAYAWAREAIRTDPSFAGAYNTLGVAYLRVGALPQAAMVFERVLALQPDNTQALANFAETLSRQGRAHEADAMRRRLAALETAPPFHWFNLGMAAMERQDFRTARDLFAKEVARADYSAQFHYWLGVAHYRLGDHSAAARALRLARENSTSRGDKELYAAKLAWLEAHARR